MAVYAVEDVGPSYEGIVQPSLKYSVAVSAMISTLPNLVKPYLPKGWKSFAGFLSYWRQRTEQ